MKWPKTNRYIFQLNHCFKSNPISKPFLYDARIFTTSLSIDHWKVVAGQHHHCQPEKCHQVYYVMRSSTSLWKVWLHAYYLSSSSLPVINSHNKAASLGSSASVRYIYPLHLFLVLLFAYLTEAMGTIVVLMSFIELTAYHTNGIIYFFTCCDLFKIKCLLVWLFQNILCIPSKTLAVLSSLKPWCVINRCFLVASNCFSVFIWIACGMWRCWLSFISFRYDML